MSVRAQCLLFAAVLCVCPGCSRDDSKKDRDSSQQDALPAEDIDRPPEPNFTEPVDYLAWYSARNFDPDWPDGEQIYGEILAAVKAGTFPMPDDTLPEKLRTAARGPWSAEEMPELAHYIESLAPYLDLFAKATDVDNVRWFANEEFDPESLHKWPLSEPTKILLKATLARAWLTRNAEPPKADSVLKACQTSFGFARHVETRGGTVPFLVSLAARATTYESITSALHAKVLTGGDIRRALESLLEHDRPSDLAEACRFEWMVLLHSLQVSGDPWKPSPPKGARRAEEWFLPWVRLAEKGWSLGAVRKAEVLDRQAERRGSHIWLSMFIVPLSRTYELGLRCEGMRRGTILTLAIHVFREEHRQWPDTLDNCGSDIEDVRVDPFSGKDFVYQLRDGMPWLYSVGCDGKDDGGKHDPRWARGKPGHDYVFWPVPQTDSGS